MNFLEKCLEKLQETPWGTLLGYWVSILVAEELTENAVPAIIIFVILFPVMFHIGHVLEKHMRLP